MPILFELFTFCTKLHKVITKTNQNTGAGYVARCDKEKWGILTR